MNATSAARKRETGRPALPGVLYAEDFDDDGPALQDTAAPAPEPEFIEPTFTVEELEQAREEAKAAGRAEAERGLTASRLQMLSTIAAGMTDTRDGARQYAESMADATARCILSALMVCLPSLCSRHGADEVRAVSQIVLPLLKNEPRITVRVHPHMIPVLESEVAALDFEIAQHIQLLPVEAMPPGDMRINWTDGAAIRDTARARTAIHDALAQLGLLDTSEPQPEMINA